MTSSSARPVAVLMAGNVLGGIGVASGIAVGALLVASVGGTALAGVGQAVSVLGSAIAAVPLARVAATHSRRTALTGGYLIAVIGAIVVIFSALAQALIPLLLGLVLFGVATATGLQTRYAAADLAEPEKRGRTLSLVVWGTTIGSVLGPNLSTVGARLGDRVGVPELAGPYLFSLVAFGAAALVIRTLLPLPPVEEQPTADHHHHGRGGPSRPVPAWAALGWALRHRVARFALLLIAIAHAVMVGVMSMTPLHIEHHGHGLKLVGLVISLHILGMYALSPVFGLLADRWGAMPVAFAALATLALSLILGAVAGPTGNMTLTTIALITLGLGWSMALIASSALFAGVDSGEVRVPLQGATDALMSYAGAAAAVIGGPLLALLGYAGLNLVAMVLLIPATVLGFLALRTRPRTRN
ncbi:MFS transporter [Enemella sp. A6]|uniref:MFS transporter n=1 Tax=Enemella sp. A6 TaxID=3440152 RepID=UPI003EB8CF37